MNVMAAELSDQDIQDLASHYAGLPMAIEPKPALSEMQARGRIKYAACAGCHGLTAEGDGVRPRLAGQPVDYTLKQMQDYAGGIRRHAVMEGLPPLSMKMITGIWLNISPPWLHRPPWLHSSNQLAALHKRSDPVGVFITGPAHRAGRRSMAGAGRL